MNIGSFKSIGLKACYNNSTYTRGMGQQTMKVN